MKINDGGSRNDETLWINDFLSTSIKSSGNQIFIEILNNGHGSKINLSASIIFGKSTMS